MKKLSDFIKKLRKSRKKSIAVGLLVVLTLTFISALVLNLPNKAGASWWDDTYGYRHRVTFVHNAALTNQSVTFTLDTAELIAAGLLQSDCDDTRFTDANGRLLLFDLTGTCDNASTTYEVIFPTIVNGSNLFYVYYGSPTASNAEIDSTGFTALTPSGGDPSLTNPTSSGNQEKSQGPVAYWSFDEGYGTTAQDGSGNNYDGTIDGASWQTEDMCVSGKCLFFDGTNDVVTVSNTVTGIQTVSFWVKVQSTSTTQELLDINGTDYLTSVSGTITATQFGTETIYVDGQPRTTVTANKWHQVTVTTTSPLSGSAIKIGQISSNYGQAFFDEVKIYNYVRSTTQIKADFQRSAGTEGSSVVLGSNTQNLKALNDGLIAYWKMDEASWTNNCSTDSVFDSSGNRNHGDACPNSTGPTTTATGKFGNAGNFDGSDDYVALTNVFNPGTADFTAAAWFNLDSGDTASTKTQSIFGNDQNTPFLGYRPSSKTFWIFPSTQSSTIATTNNLADSTWHHVALSVNQTTDVASIYLDGKLFDTISFTGTYTTNENNYLRKLGNSFLAGGSTQWHGYLDEARIYNRALSSQEVSALYNWAPGPVGYWNFDENTGSSAIDKSGNGNTGTLTNSVQWTTGKYGSATRTTINSAPDYINVGDPSSGIYDFSNTQNFTIGTWVKLSAVSGPGNAAKIINKNFSDSGASAGYSIRVAEDGGAWSLRCIYADSNSGNGLDQATISSTSITDGSWHYVTCVMDRDGSATGTVGLHAYFDGVRRASDTSLTQSSAANSGNLTFGDEVVDNSEMTGSLDDVRIYNYARTPKQIAEDMNAGHPIGGSPVASQVVYYPFDEMSGSTTNNSNPVQQGITGNISGASWKTGTNCKLNGCLEFDGTDDVVTVTNTSAIDLNEGLAGGFTFSTWFLADSDGEGDAGQIFQKGANTWCRTDSQSGSNLDLECSLDLATDDATLNIASAVTTGTWNHLALGYTDDADDEITIWINGVRRGSSTNGSGAPAAESSDILIGGTTATNFDGRIDEFKIYAFELALSEIQIDMNAGSAISLGGVLGSQDNEGFGGNPPLAYWNLNENTGSAAKDVSGTGYNGTLINGPVFVPGKSGGALRFNDTNYVQISGKLGEPGVVTITAWVNATTGGEVFSIADNVGLRVTSERARGFYYNGTTWLLTDDVTNYAGSWHHFAYVLDPGNSSQILYVDGRPTATSSDSDPVNYTLNTNTFLARHGGGLFGYAGIIDEVKVYNYARTPAQIAYDFNRGAPVARWEFDECQGSTAYDTAPKANRSSNRFNGTINTGGSGDYTSAGSCNSGTGTESWNAGTTGKFSASLGFDGADDYVSIADNNAFDFTGDFTVSAWAIAGATGSMLVSKTDGGSTGGYAILTGLDGEIYCRTSNGSEDTDDSRTDYGVIEVSSAWRHILISKSGSECRIYVDGIERTDFYADHSTVTANSLDLTIGTRPDLGGEYWNGKIDDVRIYNYALSASQIKNIYNNGAVTFGPAEGSP